MENIRKTGDSHQLNENDVEKTGFKWDATMKQLNKNDLPVLQGLHGENRTQSPIKIGMGMKNQSKWQIENGKL
jgi:hypothetical protein